MRMEDFPSAIEDFEKALDISDFNDSLAFEAPAMYSIMMDHSYEDCYQCLKGLFKKEDLSESDLLQYLPNSEMNEGATQKVKLMKEAITGKQKITEGKILSCMDHALLMSYLAFCYSANGQMTGSKIKNAKKAYFWADAAFIGSVHFLTLTIMEKGEY